MPTTKKTRHHLVLRNVSHREQCLTPTKCSATSKTAEYLESLRPYIASLAHAVTHDPTLTDDVIQEVVTKTLGAKRTPTDPLVFKAWIRTTTIRTAIDALPKQTPDLKLEPDPDPTTNLAVRQTVTRLQPDHRVILALAYGEQLSYAEMAETLEIPLGTVASRLSAAKAAFRKLWEDEPTDPSMETK